MEKTDSWTYIEDEFRRHLIDCLDSKKAHFDLADYFEKKAETVNRIQAFGLALVLAWLLSTQLKGIVSEEHLLNWLIPTILTLLVSILSILENVLKYNDKAQIHTKYAQKYHSLWRKCKNWKTDFSGDQMEEARITVKEYRLQLNEINQEAPHLSNVLWQKINKVRLSANNEDISKYSFEEN